jgi:hypothetical protein
VDNCSQQTGQRALISHTAAHMLAGRTIYGRANSDLQLGIRKGGGGGKNLHRRESDRTVGRVVTKLRVNFFVKYRVLDGINAMSIA